MIFIVYTNGKKMYDQQNYQSNQRGGAAYLDYACQIYYISNMHLIEWGKSGTQLRNQVSRVIDITIIE